MYPQIAMDGAGNAIVVWEGEPEGGLNAIQYNAVTDLWEGLRNIGYPTGVASIVMDRVGNAITIWGSHFLIGASRYSVVTDVWKENLGHYVGRYGLKIVGFDVSLPEPLTFFTAWNEVENLHGYGGAYTAKWAPAPREAVAIGIQPTSVNNMDYSLIVFEFDFLSETLTLREGSASSDKVFQESYLNLAWHPDGEYISGVEANHLDIYDLDFDYFGVVLDTYDGSIPTRGEVKWSNKGGRDVGILSNILCQNQGKDCTKNMSVKFAIPEGYLTAANFVDIINLACISADYGLTAVLDASVEVTDSLLGARKRNYKFMQDNLKLSKRLTDVYKKSIEIKKNRAGASDRLPWSVYVLIKMCKG